MASFRWFHLHKRTIPVTLSLLATDFLSHTFSPFSNSLNVIALISLFLSSFLFDSLRLPRRAAQPLRLHDDDADDETLHQRRVHGHFRRLGDLQLGASQRIPMELSRLFIFIFLFFSFLRLFLLDVSTNIKVRQVPNLYSSASPKSGLLRDVLFCAFVAQTSSRRL